jgi:YesN/AraC family two-component response regulator
LLLTSSDEIKLVGVASNGAEAIELVGEHSPDVVLIDLVMPEVDGVGATRTLVANEPDLPIVVLTSFSAWIHRIIGWFRPGVRFK